MQVIQLAILGVAIGAMYSLVAQGVVIIYRGSGAFNIAQGSFAMLGAFLFAELRDDHGWSTGVAILAAVAAIVVLGVVVYLVIMRPLRTATPLAKLIATLGLLITLESIGFLRWGADTRSTAPILPTRTIDLGDGLSISMDRLILILIAVAATIVLSFYFARVKLGYATAASSQNSRALAALGWSPDSLACFNWALGSGVSATAGILLAPLSGLQVDLFTVVLIAAFAAAMIGDFHSFTLTFVGAALIGIFQAEATRYIHVTGIGGAVPFIVLIIVAGLRGQALPRKGSLFSRLPELRTRPIKPTTAVILLAIPIAVISLADSEWVAALTVSMEMVIVLLSIVVITGMAGQLSLAQYAFVGVGAYISARLVGAYHWPFELGLLAAVLGAIPLGVIVGLPALRTRGINLAISTLGMGLALQLLVFTNLGMTGGQSGTFLGGSHLFGIAFDPIFHAQRFAFLVLFFVAIAFLIVTNLLRSRTGLRLIAVRANERAAASLGVNVLGSKLYAFSLSASIAALAGVLNAYSSQYALFSTYDVFHSISVLAYATVGGIGYVTGPLFGSTLAPAGLGAQLISPIHGLDSYLNLIAGASMLLIVLQDPDGLAKLNEHQFAMVKRGVRRLFGRTRTDHRSREAAGTRSADQTDVDSTADDARPLRPRGPATEGPQVLEVRGVTVKFGGVTAVKGVDLTVRRGEVVGLIGPNGAGKTTLIDSITGFNRPVEGDVLLDGASLMRRPAYRRARLGISRTFQALELFEDISIRDNVRAGTDNRSAASWVTDLFKPGAARNEPAVTEVMADLRLTSVGDRRPNDVPYGLRRLVALARALASQPAFVMLDEPGAGLGSIESEELAQVIRTIARDWGTGVLLVEHDMELVAGVCDRIVVLQYGEKIADGSRDDVWNDPRVAEAYLGDLSSAASTLEQAAAK